MLKTLIRPGFILLAFGAGYAFDNAHVFNWLIRWLLIAMLYLACLQLKPSQLAIHSSHWKILAANVLIALIPWALILGLGGRRDLALLAFFTGITPTATAAPVIIAFLNGRVGYVVTAFVITNIGIALMLLGLLPLVTGNLSWLFMGKVGLNLLLVIGLPLIAGTLTRIVHPAASQWPSRCRNFSFGLWIVTMFLIAASGADFLKHTPGLPSDVIWLALGGSFALCALNFTVGRWLGGRRLGRETSQALGQKNTSFTIFLALTFANPLVAMGPTFYVLWHNLWNCMQMWLYDRRQFRRRRDTADGSMTPR